ncbi:MAG TPA: DUF2332 family protein, partial [Euzebya sp.]|nr:DUF2332 family protein [Euzebya sp.]
GLPPQAHVVARRGCDPAPGDPTDPATRETLTASVWADQQDRHARLKGALDLAAAVPAELSTDRAGPWLQQQLAARPEGVLTAVTHSVVWRYLPSEEQSQVTQSLAQHGAQATPTSPLVWLRLEPAPPLVTYDGRPYPLTATTWPGGDTVVLARAQAHGQDLRWSAA